jgi:uncharacterized protein (DUF362 family)
MMTISRRALLRAAAAGPLTAATAARPAVALITGGDRYHNVLNALLAVDDQIRPALKRKRRVVIKPNCVVADSPLSATHVDTLHAVLEYLRPRFRGPIAIAESSRFDTEEAYRNYGYGALKLPMIDLNEEQDAVPFELVDGSVQLMQVRLARRLLDADAFIFSVARPKAHDAVVATLSVKNMAMAAPLHAARKSGEKWHDKSRYHIGYRQMHFNIMLTAKVMRPAWGAAVIDAWEGMEGDGPIRGTAIASRFALASTDLVAADRVGVEAMGVDPAWVGYLNYCGRAGLGEFDLSRIELRGGVEIAAVRRPYRLHRAIQKQLEWMGPAQVVRKTG